MPVAPLGLFHLMNDAHYGHYCTPQIPFISNLEPCYNQNYDEFPQTLTSFQQQILCCDNCGSPHATFECQPMNQNFDNSNSFGFDQFQPPQYPVIHHPPQEMSIQDMEDLKQQYLDEMKSLINEIQIKDYRNEKIDIGFRMECEIKINELKENFNGMSIEIHKKKKLQQLEQVANLSTYPSRHFNSFCYDDDDDEDDTIAITPVLPTVEPDNSLSMGDEHLSTIPEKEESSVEDLVPIPSEFEGIPDNMCEVPFRDNSPPLDISKDQIKDFSDSNNGSTSINDDSFSIDDINYVEASPPDSELVSLEEVKDFDPKDREIDTALKDNPTPSTDSVLKSPSSFPYSFLEETDTSDNSLPESEIFCFNLEDKSSGNPTSYIDLSLPDYEAFFCDSEPDSGDFTMDVVEDIFDNPTRVHVPNVLPTHSTLHLDSNFTYVVWIFLSFLTYLIAPLYLLSSGNEDTIFDPGISIYHSFMPGHRSGTFMKFNVYPNHLNERPMEILSSTCFPMDQ
ncbi:hypothetical protein Tco_1285129 [Tanacetum coccineum]